MSTNEPGAEASEDEQFEIVLRPLLDLAMEFTIYHEENPRLRDRPNDVETTDQPNLASIASKLNVSSAEQRAVLSEDTNISLSKKEDTQANNETRRRPSQLRKSLSTDDIGNYNGTNAWIMDKPMVKSIDATRPKEYDRVIVGDILEAVDSIATGAELLVSLIRNPFLTCCFLILAASMTFEQTMTLLEKGNRPMRLRFRRPHSSTAPKSPTKRSKYRRCLSASSIDVRSFSYIPS